MDQLSGSRHLLPSLMNVRSVHGFHRRIWVPEVLTFTKLSPDFHTCAMAHLSMNAHMSAAICTNTYNKQVNIIKIMRNSAVAQVPHW